MAKIIQMQDHDTFRHEKLTEIHEMCIELEAEADALFKQYQEAIKQWRILTRLANEIEKTGQ